jgi:nucleotide-binding universal stress UspA family protein
MKRNPSLETHRNERQFNRPRSDTRFSGSERAVNTAAPMTRRYRRILVPVNGEPFAEHALPFALQIAQQCGGRIQLVHVHSPLQSLFRPDQLYFDGHLDRLQRRRQREYLDDLYRRVKKVSSVTVWKQFVVGREVAVSLLEAASAGTDLVVMATHGRSALGRLWAGSVSDTLMQRSSQPLLLVKGHDAPADLTGNPLMRRVLVPLDGSDHAAEILKPVMALGDPAQTECTLLLIDLLRKDRSARGSLGKERWDYLNRMAARLVGRVARVNTRILLGEERVAEGILRYAQDREADLIALATHGRGGLDRLFNGSVADQVVRGASVPVLVYRPSKHSGAVDSGNRHAQKKGTYQWPP